MTVPNKRTASYEKLQFITSDGTVYDFNVPPTRVVWDVSGMGMAEYDLNTTHNPYQHGVTAISARFVPREIGLILRHNECTRYNYWDVRSNLLNTFRINRSIALTPGVLRKIYYKDGVVYTRDINAFFKTGLGFAGPRITEWDEHSVQEELTFYAPDPIFYDPTAVTLTLNSASDVEEELVFPMTFPFVLGVTYSTTTDYVVNYVGTFETYPTITITGPASDFAVRNETTNVLIGLNYDILAGETVTITLTPLYNTVVSSSGANLIGFLSEDSSLVNFNLQPGNNTLKIAYSNGNVTTVVSMTYYTRYIGV